MYIETHIQGPGDISKLTIVGTYMDLFSHELVKIPIMYTTSDLPEVNALRLVYGKKSSG